MIREEDRGVCQRYDCTSYSTHYCNHCGGYKVIDDYTKCKRYKRGNPREITEAISYYATGRVGDNTRGKKVRQIHLTNGTEIKVFDTITEAAKECGVSVTAISQVCHYIWHSAGGYRWEFVEE